MGRATTPTKFKVDFCTRLKERRGRKGFSQPEFAELLGLLPNTYSKYEHRSLLPHYLIPKACAHLEIDIDFLYTGHSRVHHLRSVK